MKYSNEEIKSKVNKIGAKSNPPFKFVRDTGLKYRYQRLIEIKNIKTGEIKTVIVKCFDKISNPWFGRKRFSSNEVKTKINNIGLSSCPSYRYVGTFFTLMGKRKERVVEVKNIKTGKSVVRRMNSLIKGHNPFLSSSFAPRYPSDEELKKIINDIGKKLNPRFIFVRKSNKKSGNNWLIEVKNLDTGERRFSISSSLKAGRNPWGKELTIEEIKLKVNNASNGNKRVQKHRNTGPMVHCL